MKLTNLLLLLSIIAIFESCRNDDCEGFFTDQEIRNTYGPITIINDSNDVWFTEIADTMWFTNDDNKIAFVTQEAFIDTVEFQINQQKREEECGVVNVYDKALFENKVIQCIATSQLLTIEYRIAKQVQNEQGKTDNNPNEFPDDFYVNFLGQKFGFNHLNYPALNGVQLGNKTFDGIYLGAAIQNTTGKYVKEVYLNLYTGLVAFKYSNGELWVRE